MRRLLLCGFVVTLCWAQHRPAPPPPPPPPSAMTGSLNLSPGSRLKVISGGAVTIRGKDGAEGQYWLRQSPPDPDDPVARRTSVRVYVRGGWTVLDVSRAMEDDSDSSLNLVVPKSMERVVLITRDGAAEAYDIAGSVQLETSSGRVQLDRIGGNAIAKTGGGLIRVGSVGGTLRCMSGGGTIQVDRAGGETWCESAGGEILIAEAGGPVHAVTAGNIQIGHAASSVNARSAGGLIDIGAAGGAVVAQTGGGSIGVGRSKGVVCESAVGTIRVKGVGGPLRAYTAMGSILAEVLPGVHLEDSSLNATRGDVTVFLPSNLSVSVQAWNEISGGRGRIVSDFPEIRVRRNAERGPVAAEGALNGGGPVLRISAAGNIYLRRQK
jgi:hypothetical protein